MDSFVLIPDSTVEPMEQGILLVSVFFMLTREGMRGIRFKAHHRILLFSATVRS